MDSDGSFKEVALAPNVIVELALTHASLTYKNASQKSGDLDLMDKTGLDSIWTDVKSDGTVLLHLYHFLYYLCNMKQ